MVAGTETSNAEIEALEVVPIRYWGRWLSAILLGFIMLGLVVSMVTNPRFRWEVVAEYMFAPEILSGLNMTILLTVTSMAMGIVLGVILALMRLSGNPVLATVSSFYLWAFRGTPLLVQLIFWYNLSALYPQITIGFPFGPNLGAFSANEYITVFVAALLGLGLNEGAYMAEIVRSGLNAINKGQTEAAEALGMTRGRVIRRIVLPQAMRIIIPPTGNQLIGMLKTTSLVSVIAMQELLYSAQLIYTANFQTIPLLIVASVWYLVLTTVLSVGQHYLEKHYSKGDRSRSLKEPKPAATAA